MENFANNQAGARQPNAEQLALRADAYGARTDSILMQAVNGLTSTVLDQSPMRDEINEYIRGGAKTATLFMRGKTGLAGAAAVYALDQIGSNDSATTQVLDAALGALKGGAIKAVFAGADRVQMDIATKALSLGIGSRLAENTFDRRSYLDRQGQFDASLGLARVVSGSFDPRALATDVVSFGIAHVAVGGANTLTGGAINRSAFLSTAATGAAFGLASGANSELARQSALGQFNLTEIGRKALIQAAVDTVASIPGGVQASRMRGVHSPAKPTVEVERVNPLTAAVPAGKPLSPVLPPGVNAKSAKVLPGERTAAATDNTASLEVQTTKAPEKPAAPPQSPLIKIAELMEASHLQGMERVFLQYFAHELFKQGTANKPGEIIWIELPDTHEYGGGHHINTVLDIGYRVVRTAKIAEEFRKAGFSVKQDNGDSHNNPALGFQWKPTAQAEKPAVMAKEKLETVQEISHKFGDLTMPDGSFTFIKPDVQPGQKGYAEYQVVSKENYPSPRVSTSESPITADGKGGQLLQFGDSVILKLDASGKPDGTPWVINSKVLAQRYKPVTGKDGIYSPRAVPTEMVILPGQLEIKTPWGTASGQPRDMLVRYGEGDYNICKIADLARLYERGLDARSDQLLRRLKAEFAPPEQAAVPATATSKPATTESNTASTILLLDHINANFTLLGPLSSLENPGEPIHIRAIPDSHINDASFYATKIANDSQRIVILRLQGIDITIKPGSNATEVAGNWYAARLEH